jgi:hypothetical protein
MYSICHSFKKDVAKVQKWFHVFNERETQNEINIKSLLPDANLLSKIMNMYKLLNANKYSNL